jgi:peptidoglycan hydrolase-like protein with peptidoglycan-binding domain
LNPLPADTVETNMKRFLLVLLLGFSPLLHAEEQTRAVQELLKDKGFYYGEVDGNAGAETSAAIRRYQIRNGLQVTGDLDQETASSMKIGRTPEAGAPPVPEQEEQQPDLRAPASRIVESDKQFLNQRSKRNPPPPAAGIEPAQDSRFSEIFRRTPYETAPDEVREKTLRRAQMKLSRDGFYRGPEMERALIRFQDDAGLPRSGRMDMETLAEMDLLPGRAPIAIPRVRRPVYRGIWVD